MIDNDSPKPPTESEPDTKVYISPRLRAKLQGRIEEEEEASSSGKWIGMAMLAGLVIFGGWLAYSMMSGAKPEGSDHTANAEEAAPAPLPATTPAGAHDTTASSGLGATTTPTPTTGSSVSEAAIAAAKAAQAGTPQPAKPAPTSGASATATGAGDATPAPAAPSRTYGIEVGTYLFEDRASTIQQELATSTSLDAKVVTRTEGGATTYAVVLGSFESRGAAETKGSELLSAGAIKQSKVVPVN